MRLYDFVSLPNILLFEQTHLLLQLIVLGNELLKILFERSKRVHNNSDQLEAISYTQTKDTLELYTFSKNAICISNLNTIVVFE